MPRVIVTTDPSSLPSDMSVLLDEQVGAVHVSSRHGAAQLAERIAWAIADAEAAERSHEQESRAAHGAPARTRGARSVATRSPRRGGARSVTVGARSR
jgi:hypothetical protein